MHQRTVYKQLYDPLSHYSRGVLYIAEDTFTFSAYRVPYVELETMTWKTEQAFTADYRRMIERKYSLMQV